VIVMGSHGRTGLERFVMGSVAERVVGSGIAPTLIVPPHDEHPATEPIFRQIVCAVDLLPSSMEGLRYAMSLAREADATLEVVYVAEEAGADEVQMTQHFRVPEYLRHRAEEALQEIRQHIPDEAREGCTIRERVIFGKPAPAILHAAREAGADLIVMGAGDRAHLRSLWLGSTTSRIAHDAGCPMLIVPTPSLLKRAIALEAKPVAREYWRDTLERISLAHQGDPATVSVMSPGFSAPEANALPLIGLTMDMPPSGDIAVILGDAEGAHISHVIPRPTEVLLDEAHTHAVTRLLVRSADGTSTLLEVTRRVGSALAALADARIQL
jgi:nucleotide-binding universal stress UspA family protein